MTGRTVAITTLGCKSNQYDSSALESELVKSGFTVVEFPGPADAVVINTCTVTSRTDSQSRQLARRARRENPGATVIVTGCYAQVSPGDVEDIDGVDFVVGNPDKGELAGLLSGPRPGKTVIRVSDYTSGTPFSLRARGASGRTRATLKVQEGCNRSCSYCIIPRARGASKSLPIDEVRREFAALVEGGYKEVVLTGIHLGDYGTDLGYSSGVLEILRLVEKEAWPVRVRLSSLDPDEVTEELVDFMADSDKVCKHLHIPLQSGDDRIIRKMKRPYTSEDFTDRVLRAKELIPGVGIGVDVIAGFPGEGPDEFESTRKVLDELPVSYLHVFPFSARGGTPAEGYPGRVDPAGVKKRCAFLKALDIEKRGAFYSGLVGSTAEVLVESTPDKSTGLPRGRSGNYAPVVVEGADLEGLANTVTRVRLTGSSAKGMRGVVESAARMGAV